MKFLVTFRLNILVTVFQERAEKFFGSHFRNFCFSLGENHLLEITLLQTEPIVFKNNCYR